MPREELVVSDAVDVAATRTFTMCNELTPNNAVLIVRAAVVDLLPFGVAGFAVQKYQKYAPLIFKHKIMRAQIYFLTTIYEFNNKTTNEYNIAFRLNTCDEGLT